MPDIIKQFQALRGHADVVVVADAERLSTQNLTALNKSILKFVVGSRQLRGTL